jgi:signal transduction histidine kinase
VLPSGLSRDVSVAKPPVSPSLLPDSTNPPSPDRFPVLVIEDDEAIRKLSTRFLAGHGYAVSSASCAEDALEAMKLLEAPILVVDQNLPHMTGIELVETLRSARQDFEAVLVTAHADVDSLTRSLKAGFFQCVHKPFHNEDLLAAVSGAANRLWLRLDLRARKADLEKRNAELQATVKQLSEAHHQRVLGERLASIGRLAAGVAHEINSPLAAVIANLALMSEELGNGASTNMTQLSDMLHDAREAAERVRTIVRDLRTFSRVEEERVGAVDLRRTIDATINMVFNEIRHRARLVKDYGETAEVEANEGRLGQVVLNLLINAAQAIPEGNVASNEIRVVTRDRGDRVMLEVRDTGAGMSASVVERIFEPFFTTKPIGLGTGLGLSISHSIISAYGGEIEVESTGGSGSVFRVLLPRAKSRVSIRAVTPEPPPVRAGRILIVDDDAAILRALDRVLGKEHEVVTVTGAREALDRIARGERFDIILCDIMMPDMTGMDLYETLGQHWAEGPATMIFLTGGTFTPRARAFLDHVPNLRLIKPFEPKQLRTVIAERLAHPAVPPVGESV